MKKIAFLVLLLALVACTTIALAAPTTFQVSSSAEMLTAIDHINAAGSGEFIIKLQKDIDCNGFSIDKPVSVTILGNGYSVNIVSNQGFITVCKGAKLYLGSAEDKTNTLTISGGETVRNDNPGLLYVLQDTVDLSNRTRCTMYEGVTIEDAKSNNYLGGGVTVEGGIFEMKGGTIRNCRIEGGSVCFGGGVAVFNNGEFIMNDGLIENCYVSSDFKWDGSNYGQLVSTCAGGGVFVSERGSFIMNGGAIKNCHADNDYCAAGGGVAALTTIISVWDNNDYGYLDSYLEINGGEISNCTTDFVGGGIAAGGKFIYVRSFGNHSADLYYQSQVKGPGIKITGGSINNNKALEGGGIFLLWIRPNIQVSISNMEITGNEAKCGGGIAIESYWTQANIDNCLITDNKAVGDYGGGLYIYDNTSSPGATVTETTIIANNLSDVAASDVYLNNSIISSQPLPTDPGKGTLYKNTMPADLHGNEISIWYKDEEASRFVNQSRDERSVVDSFGTSGSNSGEKFLIAAPGPFIAATITKIWNDANNADGIRPSSLSVSLAQNNQVINDINNIPATVTLTPDVQGYWQETIKLPVADYSNIELWEGSSAGYSRENTNYSFNGNEINIVVINKHDNIAASGTLTNENMVNIKYKVEKIWDDSEVATTFTHPEITLLLCDKDDDTVYRTGVIAAGANPAEYTFNDVPKYKDNETDTLIQYVIKEEIRDDAWANVDGVWYSMDGLGKYTATVTNATIAQGTPHDSTVNGTVSNKYELLQKNVNINVTKAWKDHQNENKARPQSIKLGLFKSASDATPVKEATLNNPTSGQAEDKNDAPTWTGVFEDLPLYEGTTRIDYSTYVIKEWDPDKNVWMSSNESMTVTKTDGNEYIYEYKAD